MFIVIWLETVTLSVSSQIQYGFKISETFRSWIVATLTNQLLVSINLVSVNVKKKHFFQLHETMELFSLLGHFTLWLVIVILNKSAGIVIFFFLYHKRWYETFFMFGFYTPGYLSESENIFRAHKYKTCNSLESLI